MSNKYRAIRAKSNEHRAKINEQKITSNEQKVTSNVEGFLPTILKTRKNVYEVIFFDTLKYVYSESVLNTLCFEIKHILKKLPSHKINVTKNVFFFSFVSLDYHSFTIRFAILVWAQTQFVSVKLCVGFPIFDSVLFFVQQNPWTLCL